MTDKEKKALKELAEIYLKLNDDDRERFVTFGEGMANVRDRVRKEIA